MTLGWREIGILLSIGALSGACAHQNSTPAGPPPPSSPSRMLDAELPAFKRPTLQGGTFDTAASSGRILVVDFFAAYCKPCQRSLPALEALQRQQPTLKIIGISLDDNAAGAWKMVKRHHLTFPVIHDSGNVLAGRLRVTELPVSFIVDGKGRIRWVGGPDQPEDALARAVAALTSTP
jgi:cytochrome c biogenesis protein CcmG/thiol:disulfide interchange protein DsbE